VGGDPTTDNFGCLAAITALSLRKCILTRINYILTKAYPKKRRALYIPCSMQLLIESDLIFFLATLFGASFSLLLLNMWGVE
jgi:hypothetical protein